MARTRSAGFELQRELMLGSAAQLFATRGYTASTMQDLAAACGVSKATLYHYVREKYKLLAQITRSHVARLEALAAKVQLEPLDAHQRLSALMLRFMQVYARSRHEHRVLTDNVKFLAGEERQAVLATQRRVASSFADAVAALRPDLVSHRLHTPMAMLLFGMMNWTSTWLSDDGALTHASLAPLVLALFLGGLPAVQPH